LGTTILLSLGLGLGLAWGQLILYWLSLG